MVSLFAGKGKPSNLEELLRPFLTELIQLQSEVLEFEGKVIYAVEITFFRL
jgi:hypothetical protein